jgi:hypothetical protein
LTNFWISGLSWTADKLQLSSAKEDPDMEMDAADLIRSKGYPVEEHTAITNDGFLLGLQVKLRDHFSKLYYNFEKL